jgi:glycosyltransferase involved in cell wall biosynthesis
MKIAIFDHAMKPNRPGGNCNYQIVRGLCHEHEFTVFSLEIDNPCPERVRWQRIRVPRRPPVVSQLAYYAVGPMRYWQHRRRQGTTFDVVQIGTSNLWMGDVSYSHFCHRAYLRNQWRDGHPRGARGAAKLLEHLMYAAVEPLALRRMKKIAVLSPDFASELEAEYPFVKDKLTVIPNPVDVERMRPPAGFSRMQHRASLGFSESDIVLVFCALGHFERKGLPLLMRAQAGVDPAVKLLVVGGEPPRVAEYSRRAAELNLDGRISFVGTIDDLRPYLWSADGFVLPSAYEIRPMVALEAAAAGLPLLMSRFHGSHDVLEDGASGIEIERTVDGIAAGLRRFIGISAKRRRQMGECARMRALPYSIDAFVSAWRDLYRELDVA